MRSDKWGEEGLLTLEWGTLSPSKCTWSPRERGIKPAFTAALILGLRASLFFLPPVTSNSTCSGAPNTRPLLSLCSSLPIRRAPFHHPGSFSLSAVPPTLLGCPTPHTWLNGSRPRLTSPSPQQPRPAQGLSQVIAASPHFIPRPGRWSAWDPFWGRAGVLLCFVFSGRHCGISFPSCSNSQPNLLCQGQDSVGSSHSAWARARAHSKGLPGQARLETHFLPGSP